MGLLEFLQGKAPKLEEQLVEIKEGIFTCWIGGADDVIDGAYNYLYANPDLTNPFNWDQVKIILDENEIRTSSQLVWYSMGIAKRFRGPNPLSLLSAAVGTENKPLDISWKDIEAFKLKRITMMGQKKAGFHCVLVFQNQSLKRKEWVTFRFHHEEVLRIFIHQVEEHKIRLDVVGEQDQTVEESDSSEDVEKVFSISGQRFDSFPLERKIDQVEEKTVLKIMEKLEKKETEDLVEIWNIHDTEEWTDEAFEGIRRILIERRDQEGKP